MGDIFISYSRKDIEFVSRLNDALQRQGFDVWVDLKNIPISADWWQAIQRGIEGANATVFVLSPASLTSPICHLELAHAIAHHKRLIPILRFEIDTDQAFAQLITKKLDDNTQQTLSGRDITTVARQNWNVISSHNFLHFPHDQDAFDEPLAALVRAYHQDIDYVREHTRLEVRASFWVEQKRRGGLLLTGSERRNAAAWLDQARGKDPPPTPLHREYIHASARRDRRNRSLSVAVMASLIAMGLFIGGTLFTRTVAGPLANRELSGTQLNIAIAEIGIRTEPDGAILITDESRELSSYVHAQLVDAIDQFDDATTPEREIDLGLGRFEYVEMEAAEALSRLGQVAALAEDMSAQVVIHGYVDASGPGHARFYPEYYIDPDLFGAGEISGLQTFGAPIELDQFPVESNTPQGLVILQEKVLPRVRALRHLLVGLAYFKVGVSHTDLNVLPKALLEFRSALGVEDAWIHSGESDTGQALVKLWIGSIFERAFLLKLPAENLVCPWETDGELEHPLLDCALESYQQSVSLDPAFARAHIGIGNVRMDAAAEYVERMAATPPDICELGGVEAANNFSEALEMTDHLPEDTHSDPLLAIKATYNIGIAYRDTHNRNCYLYVTPDDPTHYLIPARQQFDQVVTLYADLPMDVQILDEAMGLLASALMERAQAERRMGERTTALATLEQVVSLATVSDDQLAGEKPWQQIRWKAHAVRSAIYAELAQIDSAHAFEHWQSALEEAQRLLWRLEQPGVYDDQRTTHNAYYFAGRAEEALGNLPRARAHYTTAIDLGDPSFTYYGDAQERLERLRGDS